MKNLTPELSEIIGLLCAEGSHVVASSSYWGNDGGKPRYYKNHKSNRIEFSNEDKKLLEHYQNLLKIVFDYETKITKDNKVNICKKDIVDEIINHTELGHLIWNVPKTILGGDDISKIRFLRGFLDGDGSLTNNLVRFFSTNKNGLDNISKLLNDLGMKHTFQKPMMKKGRKPLYYIQLSRKEREKFLKLVKPISKQSGNSRG
jgi:intein/homing endonuclease